MAFNTSSQTGETTGNKELKLEKKVLEKEIGALGVQHEKTAEALKEIELRKSKIKDNKKELCQLEEKKKKLQAKCSEIEIEIGEGEKKLATLKEQHAQRVAALNLEISTREGELKGEFSEIEEKIIVASKELAILKIGKEKLVEEKNTLIGELKELEGEAETLEENSVKLEKILKELPEKERSEKELTDSIARLANEEVFLIRRVKNLRGEMKEFETRSLKTVRATQKFEREKGAIKEKFDKEMEERTISLDKRDGLVSEKEEWIKGKETSLRKAKAELEKFYNRKINHVII